MKDITQQVEQRIEKVYFIEREAEQRCTPPGEKGCGSPASEEEPRKERVKFHLHRSVLPGLCLPSGLMPGFFFQTWPSQGPLSGMHTHSSAKMDLKVKASGRSKTHYGLELSPDFWPQDYFQVFVISLLSFTQTLFLPLLVLAMIIPWDVYKRQRLCLPCFCCYFHFQANRGLVVNSSTGAHHLLPQEMQRGSWLIVNVQTGASLSLTSLCPWNSPGKNTGVGSHSLL